MHSLNILTATRYIMESSPAFTKLKINAICFLRVRNYIKLPLGQQIHTGLHHSFTGPIYFVADALRYFVT